MDTFYTPAQVAAMLHVSRRTIERRFRDRAGVLAIEQPGKPGRRHRIMMRISQSALDTFIANNSRGFAAVKSTRRAV